MVYKESYCQVVSLSTHSSISFKGLVIVAPMEALREHDMHSPVLELWRAL